MNSMKEITHNLHVKVSTALNRSDKGLATKAELYEVLNDVFQEWENINKA